MIISDFTTRSKLNLARHAGTLPMLIMHYVIKNTPNGTRSGLHDYVCAELCISDEAKTHYHQTANCKSNTVNTQISFCLFDLNSGRYGATYADSILVDGSGVYALQKDVSIDAVVAESFKSDNASKAFTTTIKGIVVNAYKSLSIIEQALFKSNHGDRDTIVNRCLSTGESPVDVVNSYL